MKFFVAIFTFLFVLSPNLDLIRKNYVQASKSKQHAETFYNLVNKERETSVIKAYKGAAIALKAKFTSDKKQRKNWFVKGVTKLENAIKEDANNTEIRLIRLSIQENTPKILKYKSNITEDKSFIISNFDKQNKSLKEYIRLYVKQSKVFNETEKAQILN